MRLIGRHLSQGLFYTRSFRLIPAFAGTVMPIFWQLINLYGTLPGVILVLGVFQIAAVLLAGALYPLLFFKLSFLQVYLLAVAIMVFAVVTWQVINIRVNRKAGFKLIKLQYATRSALFLLTWLLGDKFLDLPLTPEITYWDLHFKPHLAGQLQSKSREEMTAAIRSDYNLALKHFQDAIFFGVSPGSFKKLLLAAGLGETQFIMTKAIIPVKHARIFGLKRQFYLYVIFLNRT